MKKQAVRWKAFLALLLLAVVLTACGKTQTPPAAPPENPSVTQPAPEELKDSPPEPSEPVPAGPDASKPQLRHPDPANFTSAEETVDGAFFLRWTADFFLGFSGKPAPCRRVLPAAPGRDAGDGGALFPRFARIAHPLGLPKRKRPGLLCVPGRRASLPAGAGTHPGRVPLGRAGFLGAGGGSGEMEIVFALDYGDYYRYVSYDNFEWYDEAAAFDFVYRDYRTLENLAASLDIESGYQNPVPYHTEALSTQYSFSQLREAETALLEQSADGIFLWQAMLMEQPAYQDCTENDLQRLEVYYDEARQQDCQKAHPEEAGQVLLLSSQVVRQQEDAFPQRDFCLWTLTQTGGGWQVTGVTPGD